MDEENENTIPNDDELNSNGTIPTENLGDTDSESGASDTDISAGNNEDTNNTPTSLEEETEEKVKVNYYEYYTKITKTRVLSSEEEKVRRIAASKGEDVEDIESIECYHQKTTDEELNVLKAFIDTEFEAVNEIPEDVTWFKSKTENIIEYSYNDNEETEETEETEITYVVVTEFFYKLYESEKDKPEERVSGFCIDCKHALLSTFPFPHFVCSKRKRVCGVTGHEIYFRCKDFNEHLECNLWEEIPPEEEPIEESPETPEGEENENPGISNEEGNGEAEDSRDETEDTPTDDTDENGDDSGTTETEGEEVNG